MTRLIIAAVAVFMVALFAAPAMAQSPVSGPKVAVHIVPHPTGKTVNFCNEVAESTMTTCSQFVTHGDLRTGYDLFVVVAQADTQGVAGATFGIRYDNASSSGVDIVGGQFVLCASGLQYPSTNWPQSGSGNVITWNPTNQCGRTRIPPDGIHGTVGGFYVYAYSDDAFQITEHTKLESGAKLVVANCLAQETRLDPYQPVAGWVGFGGMSQCNPCLVDCSTVAVQNTTWGRLKTRYPRVDQNE